MSDTITPGCSDCYFLGKKVGYNGDITSPFVILGESPGVMELHRGKAFVGDAGKLLRETLKAVGLEDLDQEPFYTNAIHCLPRRKDPEKLAAACLRCRSKLLSDLALYPRKLILALGNGALWSSTGNFDLKITKERGKLFPSPLAELGILVAVHPAFLLRGGGNFVQFKRDLSYAIELMMDGEDAKKLPNGVRYQELTSKEEVAKFALELKQKPALVAADIETTGFSFIDDKVLEIGIQRDPRMINIIPGELITPDLFENDCRWVWHNGKFDVKFLIHQYKAKAQIHEDTMLMSYALNERGGIHDLDQVASDWLGSPNHKHIIKPYLEGKVLEIVDGVQIKRKKNYGDIPVDIRRRYAALDVNDTYQLALLLREKVRDDKNVEKFYTRSLIPASTYLRKVEMNGFRTDKEQIAKNEIRLGELMVAPKAALAEIAIRELGHEINLNSWQQVQKLLYGALRLGNMAMATNEKVLKTLPKHEAVTNLLAYRKVQKSLSTYVLNIGESTHSDGKIHPTFKQHGTATSRLACADPNAQNIPRDPELRGQLIPDPGYGLLECDLSQAELRCLAELSGCTALSNVFLQGLDLHNELSTFLFGAGFTKEDKMKAKTINFGIVYGREAPSIAEVFKVSVEEAQSWIDGWMKRFPGAAAYIQTCRNAPALNQTITTCFGNKKRPGVVTMEKLRELQNESANFPHQAIASWITNHSGIELIDDLQTRDITIVNTVHDCLVMQIPLNQQLILDTAKLVTTTMQAVAPKWGLKKIPFKAEAEFGMRWGNLVKIHEVHDMIADENGVWQFDRFPQHIAAH